MFCRNYNFKDLHKLPSLECYWNDNIFYINIDSTLFTKNYYLLLSKALLFSEKESFDCENDKLIMIMTKNIKKLFGRKIKLEFSKKLQTLKNYNK